jgi:hypothetical protein
MSNTEDRRPMSTHPPQGASESFAEYTATEKARRQDSGEEFDRDLFDEAVDLVARKLKKLEDEGLA